MNPRFHGYLHSHVSNISSFQAINPWRCISAKVSVRCETLLFFSTIMCDAKKYARYQRDLELRLKQDDQFLYFRK